MAGSAADGPSDEALPVWEPKCIHLDVEFTEEDRRLIELGPVITLDEMESKRSRPRFRVRRVGALLGEKIRSAGRRLKATRQRALRGWADQDWWSLDTHVCHHLGGLLLASAAGGRSHPHTHTLESWRAELRENGEALRGYDGRDADRVAAARKALRWTASNLPQLWD